MVDVSSDISVGIADADNTSKRAVPFHLYGDGTFFVLEQVSHDGGGGQGTPERGSRGARKRVEISGALNDRGGIGKNKTCAAVLGHCRAQIRMQHWITLLQVSF